MRLEALVICKDHYNPLNVIRALGKAEIIVHAIVIDSGEGAMVLKSRYVKHGYTCDSECLLDLLNNLFAQRSIPMPVFSTDDFTASWLDEKLHELPECLRPFNCSGKHPSINFWMDKDRQLEAAASVGINVPKSIVASLKNIREVESLIPGFEYPCIVKPEKSITGSKHDFRICNNAEELVKSLREIPKSIGNVLIQQYIPNDEVFCIHGMRDRKGYNYAGGVVYKMKTCRDLWNMGLNAFGIWRDTKSLSPYIEKLMNAIDYHGLYSVDMVKRHNCNPGVADETCVMLEINLRTDGLMYFCTEAGINLPELWVLDCYGRQLPEIKPRKSKVFGMSEFSYMRQYVNSSSLLINIRDFMRTDVFSYFSWRDPMPFFHKILGKISKRDC